MNFMEFETMLLASNHTCYVINPPFTPFLRRHMNTVPKVLKVRRTDSVEQKGEGGGGGENE